MPLAAPCARAAAHRRRRRARRLATAVLAALVVAAAGCGDPTSTPTGDRVLLVGVDGATWDVIDPLIAEGKLPTFAKLVAGGWSGPLRSMEPMLSPALWTTIATGKTPEQHGIRGFLAAGDGAEAAAGGVPVTSNLRRTEALWTIAGHRGRRVNVIGWYVTWPAEAINGVMVSDRFVPEERGKLVGGPAGTDDAHPSVQPAALASDLERLFVRADRFVDPAEREFHQMFKVYPVDATRIAITEHLMEERPADLTMVYVWGIDPMQHHFWKYYQPETWPGPPSDPLYVLLNRHKIPAYYGDVDGFLARLLAHAGPRDTLLVVSDHGAGPVSHYDPDKPLSGDHRIDGIVIAYGNGVRPGRAQAAPSITDVAPTVLYLLGLPLADDMDGHLITELIAPDLLAARPPGRIATYEPAGRQEPAGAPVRSPMDGDIKERLRSLGYIE